MWSLAVDAVLQCMQVKHYLIHNTNGMSRDSELQAGCDVSDYATTIVIRHIQRSCHTHTDVYIHMYVVCM